MLILYVAFLGFTIGGGMVYSMNQMMYRGRR